MKRSIALFLLASGLSLAVAEDLTVEYIEGYLDIRMGSAWAEVEVGDTLGEDDVIRLDEGSLATLRYGGRTLNITRPGTYRIADMLSASRGPVGGLGSLVLGKVKSLVSEPERGISTAAGVRGTKSADDVSWMGDGEDLILEGKNYLGASNYKSAIEAFIKAEENAYFGEEAEILFYLGLTYTLMDNPGQALKHLDMVEPADLPGAGETSAFYVLKGQLLTETFAFPQAIDWLRNVPRDITENDIETGQAVKLYLGLSYRGVGDRTAAAALFDQVINADPASPYAKAAADSKREL